MALSPMAYHGKHKFVYTPTSAAFNSDGSSRDHCCKKNLQYLPTNTNSTSKNKERNKHHIHKYPALCCHSG